MDDPKGVTACLLFGSGAAGFFGLMAVIRGVVMFRATHVFEEITPLEAIATSTAGGAIYVACTILMSILFFVKIPCQSARPLQIYSLFPPLVAFMLVSAGIFSYILSAQIDHVADKKGSLGNTSREVSLNDFFLSVFQVCCVQEFNLTDVINCERDQNLGCVHDRLRFNTFIDAVSEAECKLLGGIDHFETILVANPMTTEAGCGSGDALTFVKDIVSVFAYFYSEYGFLNILFGVMTFLASCITSVLVWRDDDEEEEEPDDDEENQQLVDNVMRAIDAGNADVVVPAIELRVGEEGDDQLVRQETKSGCTEQPELDQFGTTPDQSVYPIAYGEQVENLDEVMAEVNRIGIEELKKVISIYSHSSHHPNSNEESSL